MTIVANAYLAFALLLGLPSLAGFLYFGWTVFQYSAAPALAPRKHYADPKADLIEGAAHAVGSAFSVVGSIGQGIAKALLALSVAVLLLSLFLWIIGRGLRSRRQWARVLAFIQLSGAALIGVLAALTRGEGGASLIGLLLLSGSVYGLWALKRGFVEA